MVISIASQKGGVGKTSSTISLAAGLARKGKRVLLIDIDSQANSSKVLLHNYPQIPKQQTVFATILECSPLPTHETSVPNLHIVPSHILLSNTDVELTTAIDHREERLKKELDVVKANYDYVFIDCPPTLSWLTINAFTASDKVIVVVSPGYFELDSIVQISKTIKEVREYLNAHLELAGFLFTTLSRLRSALNEAVRRKLVVRNVAQFSRVPRQLRRDQARKQAARKPWTEQEVKAFLRGIKGDRLFAVMLLSLLGLRPGEVCGLKWSAVDLEVGTLRVEWTRTLVGAAIEEKDPKTGAGERTLPLPAPVIVALRAFHTRQAVEKLKAGEVYEDGGYVLVDKWGRPWTSERLRYHAYRLMREVGVRKIRPYDARHSALTFLATSGVPDTVLAAWAGHANAAFTKRVYVTMDPEHLRVAATAFDRLLG